MRLLYRIILCILAFFGVFFFLKLFQYIHVMTWQEYREYFKIIKDNHPIAAVVAYIVLYIIIAATLIPGDTILSLIGGFLWGVIPAVIMITIAATIGATLGFIGIRYVIVTLDKSRYIDFTNTFKRLPLSINYFLLIVRLLPIFPFFIVTIGAALSPVSLLAFIIITAVGVIPNAMLYTYAGSQLKKASEIHDFVNRSMLVSGLLIIIFLLITWFIQQRMNGNAIEKKKQ